MLLPNLAHLSSEDSKGRSAAAQGKCPRITARLLGATATDSGRRALESRIKTGDPYLLIHWWFLYLLFKLKSRKSNLQIDKIDYVSPKTAFTASEVPIVRADVAWSAGPLGHRKPPQDKCHNVQHVIICNQGNPTIDASFMAHAWSTVTTGPTSRACDDYYSMNM